MAKDTAPQPQTQNPSPRGRKHAKGKAKATTVPVTPSAAEASTPKDSVRELVESGRGEVLTARELYRDALAARLGVTGRHAGDLDQPSAGDLLLWTLGGGSKASELWEALFALADDLNATADLHACLGLEEALPAPVVSRLAGLAERARILGRLHLDALTRMGAIPMIAVRSSKGAERPAA